MQYPNKIKKYAGTISKTNKKIIIKYKTKGRIFTIKEYLLSDFNSSDDAMKDAIEYKKKWSIVNNLVKNKYEIIQINEKVDNYHTYLAEQFPVLIYNFSNITELISPLSIKTEQINNIESNNCS